MGRLSTPCKVDLRCRGVLPCSVPELWSPMRSLETLKSKSTTIDIELIFSQKQARMAIDIEASLQVMPLPLESSLYCGSCWIYNEVGTFTHDNWLEHAVTHLHSAATYSKSHARGDNTLRRPNMEPRRPPEFTLELSTDRMNVKDVVKGVLHTIFFHRLFTALLPATHDVLDMTLPYVSLDNIDTLIAQRADTLSRALNSSPSSVRGQLVVQFNEKKRRKGWFVAKADEESAWETWVINVSILSARSESEKGRVRSAMEASLQKAAMDVIDIVNRERMHIPPITTNETNPFPYQISVNSKEGGLGTKMGIF
nr:meiotically up-regulated gene 66 protein [Quercus suber]